jgi:hypothetical protein
MDDFSLSNLYESRNEWSARLISILTPLVMEGINSIFEESWKLCKDNNENNKYLMTLQNLLSRVPKWNDAILEKEYTRILEKSNCTYLSDLLSCVHVIQLKILTCMRAGKEQKKVDIDIPKFNTFLHHIYINVARKIYTNIYLYEQDITPLQRQKYNREIEIMIQEAIITTIRQNMPIEELLKAYIDEHVEEDIEEEISEKTYKVEEPEKSDESWKKIDSDALLNNGSKDESSEIQDNNESLVVSNDVKSDVFGDSDQKAITFNETIQDDDLGISGLNDAPLIISNDDVMVDVESLDKTDDTFDLEIEELP